jgi:hypothetical protein
VPFDPKTIHDELDAAPLEAPLPVELARAIVDDGLRRAGRAPIPLTTWQTWQRKAHKRWAEQLGMLGHLLSATSMGQASEQAWRKTRREPARNVEIFFKTIEPLTAEMIRDNAFRQEELVRKWALRLGGDIVGETDAQARTRLDELDYRSTLKEFEKAERARKKESTRRRKLLEEARKRREAEARAWRE